MKENIHRIPANNDELNLYCQLGEALLKTQMVEQALSYSITLKMNPAETKEEADEFLKQHQTYTLGRAIKVAVDENLYNLSLQSKLNNFLAQRNWLIHKVIVGNEPDFNAGKIKEELLDKIKSVSDEAESIQKEIQYDMIAFCSSKGKKMSKILELLQLQDKGIRIRTKS
jgi:hypothetical protein